jgi:hypothetical protein
MVVGCRLDDLGHNQGCPGMAHPYVGMVIINDVWPQGGEGAQP